MGLFIIFNHIPHPDKFQYFRGIFWEPTNILRQYEINNYILILFEM
jgi:hypothetical protein